MGLFESWSINVVKIAALLASPSWLSCRRGLPSCSSLTAAFLLNRHHPRIASRRCLRDSVSLSSSSSLGGNLRRWASIPSEDEIDPLKWERMYYGDSNRRPRNYVTIPSLAYDNEASEARKERKSQVRVVSFDLDNTLWRTSPTIAAANDALASLLKDRYNISPPKRVEVVMGDLFQANRTKYCPLEPNNAKSPVMLTQLRKDAIEHVLRNGSNVLSPEQASAAVDQAFQAWVEARHAAISSHLVPSAAECLEEIASWRTWEGHRILIGAITDGNSDPTSIDELGPYFDFCVNAERVGVSKPDSRVYLEAVAQVLETHSHLQGALGSYSASDKPVEELLGPWWVHIGDDFIKDVVAAKGLSMRTIWCRELVLPDKPSGSITLDAPPEKQPKRTVEELMEQVSELKVIRMQVGSEDYLAESFHREFADAIVDRFADVSKLLLEWHSETLQDPKNVVDDSPDDVQHLATQSAGLDPGQSTSSSDTGTSFKFCIHCGAKLPLMANFCSACGEKLS